MTRCHWFVIFDIYKWFNKINHINNKWRIIQVKNIKNIALPLFVFALASTQITACGGGGSADTASNTHPDEPIQVTASSWKKGKAITITTDNTVINVKKYHRLGRVGKDVKEIKRYIHFERVTKVANPQIKHHQVFIDIDNNSATGFQFVSDLWTGQSGADYMIEDNELYKAKTNDSTWSWEWLTTASHYSFKGKKFPGTIKTYDRNGGKIYFGSLCNNLNIGYVGRDENWNVVEFSPRSSSMQAKTVDLCDVTNIPPVITLKGSNYKYVKLNSSYVDRGATASDREDGDLTSQVTIAQNTVDTTKTGSYVVSYQVVDSDGNQVQISRQVVVIDSTDPIVIDNQNNGSEWYLADELFNASGPDDDTLYFIATDTKDYMYFYLSCLFIHGPNGQNSISLNGNWQIFIDADNNPDTGYGWGEGRGYDYIIENGVLGKFQGTNSSAWSWQEINGGVITAQRPTDTNGEPTGPIELALDKSLMAGWSKNIRVKFVSLNSDWNERVTILPADPYIQKFEVSNAYTPFQNDSTVTGIVKSGSKWFGIKGKSIVQDNGASVVTTVFTSPNSVSSLVAPIAGKIQFISLKDKGSQCRCNSRGNGHREELHSYDSVTGIDRILFSNTNVRIVQLMNNFFLVSTQYRVYNSKNRYPIDYYKVDKNIDTFKVGTKIFSEYFDVVSVDKIGNVIFVKKGKRGGIPIQKKITETIGVGLEDI